MKNGNTIFFIIIYSREREVFKNIRNIVNILSYN